MGWVQKGDKGNGTEWTMKRAPIDFPCSSRGFGSIL